MRTARKAVIEGARTGEVVPAESRTLSRVVTFLGGRKTLRARIETKLEAHDAIQKGLPSAALLAVLEHVRVLPNADLTAALGVSERTIQRRANDPTLPLSPEQSGRTWRFAEVLAKATDVLGDQDAAERWMMAPAMALDQRRPIDLLATPTGFELVEQLLGRMEYGVYT